MKLLIFIVFFIGLTVLISYLYNYDLFEKILFSIPVFSEFFRCKIFYMNSYYIYSSLKNGINLLDSVDIALDSSVGISRKVLLKVRDDIIKGVKVNESLSNFKFIPKIVVNLIKTGEDSGNFSNAFYMINSIFFSKYQNLMDKFINLLPIILITFTGMMMMGFVMTIFMPIYSFRV